MLKEKQPLEYLDVRVIGKTDKVHVNVANLKYETNELTTSLTEIQRKQDQMEECLNKLIKQMSSAVGNAQRAKVEPMHWSS